MSSNLQPHIPCESACFPQKLLHTKAVYPKYTSYSSTVHIVNLDVREILTPAAIALLQLYARP